MPSTAEDICNIALVKLGSESEIGSLAGPRTAHDRLFARLFPHYRDAELRARRWRFSIAIADLTAGGPANDADRPYAFPLPVLPFCLRPLHNPSGVSLRDLWRDDWVLVGRELWSAASGPLRLTYISRPENVGLYDADFVEALACRLALEACEKITQSNQKKSDMSTMYKDALRVAAQANAWETISENTESADYHFPFIADRI